MLLLHVLYDDGVFIWGEKSFNVEPTCVDGEHPWCASAAETLGVLTSAGADFANTPEIVRKTVVLPSFDGLPEPSVPILGEIHEGALDTSQWSVETVALDDADLLELINAVLADGRITENGCLVARGEMIGLDLCWFAECVRFVVSLLDRGHFLPDIKATQISNFDTKYDSVWRPLLIGEDAEIFGSLARTLPRSVLASRSRDTEAREALGEMLQDLADGIVRLSWFGGKCSRSRGTNTEIAVAERKKRGHLVSALNPHALWARSLGWLGGVEGLSESLESIYADVREWWARFEWFAKAPFKLCVRMGDEPDENGDWRLSYSLKLLSTGEVLTMYDVWRSRERRDLGAYMRRYSLLMLGRVGTAVPAVFSSLDDLAPSGCSLTQQDASDFLSWQAASLESMGVNITYPSWWRASSIDRLSLRGRMLSGSVDPTIFAYTAWSDAVEGGQAQLSFMWELALDGEVLTPGESRAFKSGEHQLMNIRGKWVFVRRDEIDAVAHHAERLPVKLTASEAVRLAIRDRFIDGFTNAPDLEIVYETLKEGSPRVVLGAPGHMNGKLRPYQLRGYSWMAFLTSLGFGVCLADDMGLGKTVQTLALVQHHRDMGDKRPVLLVCPTSVLENWRAECERFFPGLTTYTHHGRGRARGDDFMRASVGASMILTSYSLLARDASFLNEIDWVGVILDEGQNIKNPDTQQSRSCRGLKAEWRVVLTGTPIENHVGDLWSIMEFLMPGMLGSRRRFRMEYVKPIQEDHDEALMEALKRQVGPLIMRRMKTDKDIAPELPEKIETKVFCSLKREQASMYQDVVREMTHDIDGAEGIKRRGIVLAAITKLKQICDHPDLAEGGGDRSPARSSKLERLLALAEEMWSLGDKALIFTQYIGMGEILKSQLQEQFGEEVLFLHGGVPKEGRDEMVRRFQDPNGPKFFVLSLKAGGVGLNLTGANHVIMFDRWWNPAVEAQAIDRAYRIGQTRVVQVHVFCCGGTIEERIDDLLASKKELASKLIDGYENWITELSDKELHKLVALAPGAAE